MRKSFIIFFLYISLSVSGATYYIDPSGNNNNDGSKSYPWKTLAYACSRATSIGDIIHINKGVYPETTQSNLAVGVSIEGEGVGSKIVSSVSSIRSFTISLNSSTVGTKGNQHISGIEMDGNNLTAYGAISVYQRSNVEIYNCTFVNFSYYGVGFNGGYQSYSPPAIYATGNKFHDNTVINCSGYYPAGDKFNGEGKYALGVDTQDGMLIYNNLFDQTSRSPGSNGYLIKGVPGLNKGLKIFNNIIKKAPYDNQTWDFAIELWLCRGGIEIYDNTVTAGIDISGSVDYAGITTQKGSYDYSVYIHNNIIGPESLSTLENVVGIFLEQSTENAIVEANYIKNVNVGVYFPTYTKISPISNIDIRYNILENIGVADGGPPSSGCGIQFLHTRSDNQVRNVRIFNNTIIAHSGSSYTLWGIQVPDIGPVSNVVIRNNIVKDFDNSPVSAGGTNGPTGFSIDQISVENNIFYNNGNDNLPYYKGVTPTNNTTQNNITSNPLFVSSSDYHLQSGSPAIGKGLAFAGTTYDFDGNTVNNPPSIGAYENTSGVPVYSSSVIENATPSLLEMTYNMTLAGVIPSVSAFSVIVNSIAVTVNRVAVSGNKVQLTLANPISFGDVVTVSYTKPTVNPLQTPSGVTTASSGIQKVTNKLINISPVVEIISPVNNAPFTAGANITITANASDADGSITMVDFYNGSTKIGSKSVAPYSFTWNSVGAGTYSLKVIATDNRNTKTTSSAINISVASIPGAINQPPVVVISSPTKGNEYNNPATIDIEVVASDPDGTISKVVLYNESSIIVELTAAPYLYTWKDVKAGNYAIKAVAYDNMNAMTTSSLIEFQVGGGSPYDADSEIINLYPNPTDGNFSIEFLKPLLDEKCKIVITDLSGKPVSDMPVLTGETLMHFSLSNLKSGIYIMMVISKEILVTKKFIKY